MKRKYADYPNWSRVEEKSYKNIHVKDDDFVGNVSLLTAKKVKEKLFVMKNNKEYVLIDDGYKWLQFFPDENKNIVLSVAITNKNEIREWYFDITKNNDLTEEGVPYLDDLYLDVVFMPDDYMELLDEDELKEALDTNDISKDEFNLAYKVAYELMDDLKGKAKKLEDFTYKYLNKISDN